MTRSVLCAVDVSEAGADKQVLKTAAKVASIDGAKLDIVTVLPDYGSSIVGQYFEPHHHEKAEAEAHSKLEELVAEVLGDAANENVRHIVVTGSAYKEILKAAEASGADLIVLGAHKPDLKDFLLGPNAGRVIRHSQCSVYVVR